MKKGIVADKFVFSFLFFFAFEYNEITDISSVRLCVCLCVCAKERIKKQTNKIQIYIAHLTLSS